MGSRTPSSVPGVFLPGPSVTDIGPSVKEICLRGVTGQEVVASLLSSQLADRWENAESVASEHDDVPGLTLDNTRNTSVGNELDGVRAPSVLGDADVVVVGFTRNDIVDNVLKDRTKPDGVVDLRLLLGGKVDALGIAPTLDVENTVVRPDVLIIADQLTVGVGRQCGLSSSRESEEESDITVLRTDVGRGVERELPELNGLEVVHDGEDALLHLSRVLGTEDNHFHTLEVNLDRGSRTHALGKTVGRKLPGIVDGEIRFAKVAELFLGRSDQHVVLRLIFNTQIASYKFTSPTQTHHEKRVICTSANDADLDPVLWVPLVESKRFTDLARED